METSTERKTLLNAVFEVINRVKKTAFCEESTELDFYLGGDLGIDSREMLEIWYDLEKQLDVVVHDYDKRDIYTLEDVIKTFESALSTTGNTPPPLDSRALSSQRV